MRKLYNHLLQALDINNADVILLKAGDLEVVEKETSYFVMRLKDSNVMDGEVIKSMTLRILKGIINKNTEFPLLTGALYDSRTSSKHSYSNINIKDKYQTIGHLEKLSSIC